jgi:hypothetical protein
MDMALAQDEFVPQISVDRNGNVITPQNAPAGIFAAAARPDPTTAVIVTNPVTRETTTITLPNAARTGELAPAWGAVLGSAGRASLPGVAVSSKLATRGTGTGVVNPPPIRFYATIDTPHDGQVIHGSGAAIQIEVLMTLNPPETGQARIQNAAQLPTCRVTLDGNTDVPMSVTGPNTDGTYSGTSRAPLSFAASGSHTLQAACEMAGQNSGPKASFTVQLQAGGGGGGGNVTPPVLMVTSPADGAVIAAQFGDPNSSPEAVVPFTGSASASGEANITSVVIQVRKQSSNCVKCDSGSGSGVVEVDG